MSARIPAPVRAVLREDLEQSSMRPLPVLSLPTVLPTGWPHIAYLGPGELLDIDDHTLGLAVWDGSNSTQAAVRTGQATLQTVLDMTQHLLRLRIEDGGEMVGLVSVAQFAPQVALGPWSGAVADRGDRRRQVVSGRIISAAGSGILAVADRPSRYLLIGVATIGIGADPVITLTPLLADRLGGGAQLVGIMASGFGVGAGVAYVFLGWWQTRFGLARTGSTGLAVFAISLLLLAATPGPRASVIALGLSGIGMTMALTSQTTLLQMRVPEELRGRIMALWSVAYLGSRPLAAAFNGAVADAFSPSVALVAVSGLLVVGAVTTRPSQLAS